MMTSLPIPHFVFGEISPLWLVTAFERLCTVMIYVAECTFVMKASTEIKLSLRKELRVTFNLESLLPCSVFPNVYIFEISSDKILKV